MKSHYDWLGKHLNTFINRARRTENLEYRGMIAAHGDKCYSFRNQWNFPFEHGVAIYMLTYLRPFSNEVRETANGWVDPSTWIVMNYERFKCYLTDLPTLGTEQEALKVG